MPLPISALLDLPGIVRLVVAKGEIADSVRAALTEAALNGEIAATGCPHNSAHPNLAKYFQHPDIGARQKVPAPAWGMPIDWESSRVGRFDMVRITREEIERWLGTAAPEQSGPLGNSALITNEAKPEPRSRKRLRDEVAAFVGGHYPEGLPPTATDKVVAREYTAATGISVDPRTVRRARGGK